MGLMDAPQVGDDAGIRMLLHRITELEHRLNMVAAASAGNAGQVDFLLGQTVSGEASPGGSTTITIDPATSSVPDTWIPFDPGADAAVTLTTSSTGAIAVEGGGLVGLYSGGYAYTYGYIGFEILDQDGFVVRPPGNGDGNRMMVWGANNYVLLAANGHRHEWSMTPRTQYTLRCRRGYSVGAGPTGATAQIYFQGTAIAVTKIGM